MATETTPEERAELQRDAAAGVNDLPPHLGRRAKLILALLGERDALAERNAHQLVLVEEARTERDALAARQARWGGPSGPIARLIAEVGCDCDADTEDPPEDHTCTAAEAEAEWCALRERIAELEAELRSAEEAIAGQVATLRAQTDAVGRLRARIAEMESREPVACEECGGHGKTCGRCTPTSTCWPCEEGSEPDRTRPCEACGGRGAVWRTT